ncbi:MAG: hypothetical protein QNK04_26195 [Myxococcota bacterium]|nr:hypothetical protein [Myxococcota bacterium]
MFIRSLAIAFLALAAVLPSLAGADVRVALLPIAVHAQGEDSAYLETGLAAMLSARLEQYEGVDVVRPAADAVPATAREDAVARAREVEADFVLYGSFTRFGEGASLDLRCTQVGPEVSEEQEVEAGPARRVFIQAGTLAEIIPDLDTLAEKVARFAFETNSTPPKRGEAVAASPEAEAVSPEEVADLRSRVEALESALYTPVAQGEVPTPEQDEAAVAGDGTTEVVR